MDSVFLGCIVVVGEGSSFVRRVIILLHPSLRQSWNNSTNDVIMNLFYR
jgi:hypothetical protein